MRHIRTWLAVACCFVSAPAGRVFAQDRVPVKYWDQLEIGWPVPADVLDRTPRPSKLRLYASINRGPFEKVSERNADDLVPIPGRQPGFLYTASAEGEVEFAVQLVFADGKTVPTTDRLQAEYRVIFDTRPPAISISPLGSTGVEWSITDENLDAAATKLECRWLGGSPEWFPVRSPRSGWTARDSYNWAGLGRESRSLEVRVTAQDKAGHKASSRIVRLGAGGSGVSRDEEGSVRGAARDPLGAGAAGDTLRSGDIPGQPQIIYANSQDLNIKSKIVTVTRSGVQKVHLFMKDMTDSTGGEWKQVKEYPTNIEYQAADPAVDLAYRVPKDGRYGFIVIPESGAGRREPDPRVGTPAHFLVEVDTKAPHVKITNVTVSPGGTIGPRVEIEWEADDRNLMTDPIVLEWAASKESEKWQPIAEKVPNSRRYIWEVSDKQLYKFFIRARAIDKATNSSTYIYDKEVNIDLDRPSATIEMVKPGAGGAPGVVPAVTPSRAPDKPTSLPSRDPAPAPPPGAGTKVPDLIKLQK